MVIVTGDTHGEFSRLNNKNTKGTFGSDDYVIVAGDFGLCWSKDKSFEYMLEFFKQRKFTTLFIDGNHENFDMLEEYPVEDWHGGKARHLLRDKVIHLTRGQVFDIDSLSIFTFGGAASHDIQGGLFRRDDPDFKAKVMLAKTNMLPYRVIGESWWEQEMPNEAEMNEGIRNLEVHNWQVDYVITHTLSSRLLPDVSDILGVAGGMKKDRLTEYFEKLEDRLQYRKWYSGHYHTDSILDDKHKVTYKGMEELRQ